MIPSTLVLTPIQARRRLGLARSGSKSATKITNTVTHVSTLGNASTMRPEATAGGSRSVSRKPDANDQDINRPPEDLDSSSDEDERARTADIKTTEFRRASEQPDTQASQSQGTRSNKLGRVTVNGAGAEGNAGGRPTRKGGSSSQDNSSRSPKRKSQEENSKLGSGMVDSYGRVNVKKPRIKATFTSSQSTQKSSQSGSRSYGGSSRNDVASRTFKSSSMPLVDLDDSPKKTFRATSALPDFESPEKSKAEDAKSFKFSEIPGTPSTPGSSRKFVSRQFSPSPLKGNDTPQAVFKTSSFDDPFMDELGSTPSQTSPTTTRGSRRKLKAAEAPLTQLPSFKIHSEIDELVGPILAEDSTGPPPVLASLLESDDISNQTQRPRCPICNQPVDEGDLDDLNNMNTRMQGQFCLSHQRKSARSHWKVKGYPEIDWEGLDSRIAKHHLFIKKIINGGESHYRAVLEERVQAGKDRNLLRMTSNLTPGYYGARGLRVISENIMHEFTPLLKKRGVKDRLMAARGVTGFVQSVIVPEVAVLLIKHDMSVSVAEARDILADSATIGELIHEEVREVVKRGAEDSGDDEDFGE